MQFKPMPPCQLRDKALVAIRFFTAQLVIDVRHREHNPQLAVQFEQQAKQSDRIRSAGDSHGHAISRPHRLLLSNCL